MFETAIKSNEFIIQGTKGIQFIDLENCFYPLIVPAKNCFYGIHVEQNEERNGINIYSNSREGMKRRFIKVNVPY